MYRMLKKGKNQSDIISQLKTGLSHYVVIWPDLKCTPSKKLGNRENYLIKNFQDKYEAADREIRTKYLNIAVTL